MIAHFDRFDICEAHHLLEIEYNVSGILWERASNRRRHMSTGYQLQRMGFRPAPGLTFDTLTPNGRAIYRAFERAHFLAPRGVTQS